jgi:hypothetical protein
MLKYLLGYIVDSHAVSFITFDSSLNCVSHHVISIWLFKVKFADDDIISLLRILLIRIVKYLGDDMFKIIAQILEGGERERESLCIQARPSCSATCWCDPGLEEVQTKLPAICDTAPCGFVLYIAKITTLMRMFYIASQARWRKSWVLGYHDN